MWVPFPHIDTQAPLRVTSALFASISDIVPVFTVEHGRDDGKQLLSSRFLMYARHAGMTCLFPAQLHGVKVNAFALSFS
jgi:hypothetical protein